MDVAVDVGGTFTDFVTRRGDAVQAFKLPSTPDSPEEVLLDGLKDLEVSTLGHGTTVATNAVIEGRGANTALVTTLGFEDILTIGRQRRPSLYDLKVTRPKPLVPPEVTIGVEERVDAKGRVLRPLAEEDVRDLAEQLEALNVESVAISLLFAFLNPKHEALLADLLGDEFSVSISSQVLPEFREYERTSTTVLDAVVGPLVKEYLSRLGRRLKARLLMMRSNGGLRESESLMRRPVEMVLSGPAGGVAGVKFLSDTLGLGDVMALDMGGTSADISLLHEGQPTWTTDADIGGYPLALPVLDISTIGAGGGSIVWVDAGGALRVGPRSAGADPGPLCYGRGASNLTLTDVDLLSGLLGDALLGGGMPLHRNQANMGVTRLNKELGLPEDDVLMGVRRVVVSNMVRAAALAFAKRGLDPRDFAVVAFGGAGPMHAIDVARELGIPQVVVPPIPGAFSAYGIILSDLRLDYGRSLISPLGDSQMELDSIWNAMEKEAANDLEAQSYSAEDALLLRSLDLRYTGQSFEINVPLTGDLASSFHRSHEARFGYSMEGEPVEVVNVRLTAVLERPKPLPRPAAKPGGGPSERKALQAHGWDDVPVYDRDQLQSGFEVEGPVIVEEETSTAVLDARSRLSVDEMGCLRIEVD